MVSAINIAAGVIPAFILLGVFSGAMALYLVLSPTRDGQRPWLFDFFYWFITPLVRLLGRIGITPNLVTATSILLALCAAVALSIGQWFVGFWILSLASACDVIDGQLAREFDMQSEAGAFLDSFVDRLAEGVVYLGLAVAGSGGMLTTVAIGALIASFAVSYARARGESLGVVAKVGLMQRPQRLIALMLTIFIAGFAEAGLIGISSFGVIMLGLGIIAITSIGTAIHRAEWIMSELKTKADVAEGT